jgi:hypothetical protein
LIVDAAFGFAPEDSRRKFMASGHSRWSLVCEEPFNFFWRFNRGWIEAAPQGQFPSATAICPVFMTARAVVTPSPLVEPIMQRRRIVQLAPNAFLVIDESDSDAAQVTRFHLPLTDFIVEQGILHADYPATLGAAPIRLWVVSLSGQTPTLGLIDRPQREDFAHLATREISFSVGQHSAYLICAQASGSALSVSENELQGDGL